MKDIDVIAGCNPDNLDIVDNIFNKIDEREKSEEPVPKKLDVICYVCRGRVGFIYPEDTDVPLRGDMFHRYFGCEHWPLPGPHHGPKDFLCPHGEGGDNHLFVPLNENHPDNTDEIMLMDHTMYKVEKSSGECPCGCGGRVRGKNKYADALNCYRRHVATLKAEIENGSK